MICFWHKADMTMPLSDIRFRRQSERWADQAKTGAGAAKEERIRAWSDCGDTSADFLEAPPPARHVGWRQHVAFALGRDRQRLPGVQKIEDAIFQRVPFIFIKLRIVAGVAEVRLVENRSVRRVILGTGVGSAGEVHLRLAVGDLYRSLLSCCFGAA